MLKSSALRIIRSFSKEEMTEFDDFLKSPYFNKKSGVIKLYNEVKKYYPDFTNENLEKEKLWNKLYPDKKFSYGVMKNLIFDITKLAEQFIAQQEFFTDEIQECACLYKSLNDRNLLNLMDIKENLLKKKFSDGNLKNVKIPVENYFYYRSRINGIKIVKNMSEGFDIDYTESEYMEIFFICGLLIDLIIYNHSMHELNFLDKTKNEKILVSQEVLNLLSPEQFEKILNKIKKHSEVYYKLLNCYYLAFMAFRNLENAEWYFKFKDFFFKNISELPVLTIRDLDIFLENTFAVIKDKSFKREIELIEIYEFRHKNNLILDKYSMFPSLELIPWFLIFIHKNNLREYEEFIEFYKDKFNGFEKDNMMLLIEAVNLFLRSEFKNSYNIVSKINLRNFIAKNFLKRFTLLILYEMNEYEMFLYASDSLKHFSKYTELVNNFNIASANAFCKNIDKLFKYKVNPNAVDLKLLEEEIKTNSLVLKSWFLRKVDELKY